VSGDMLCCIKAGVEEFVPTDQPGCSGTVVAGACLAY